MILVLSFRVHRLVSEFENGVDLDKICVSHFHGSYVKTPQ